MKFTLVIPLALYRNAEIIESIKKLNYPKNDFHLIIVKGTNPSKNRNKGANLAKGEYIIFLDDDGKIKENYLKRVSEFIEKYPNIDIFGGPQLTPEDERGFAKISGYALSSTFGAFKVSKRYSSKKISFDVDEASLTSANLICKKSVMEKIKFDPGLFPGEDPKFISDAKKQGFKIAYSPEIVLYHRRRPNIKGLLKQFFNYGIFRPKKETFRETLEKPYFLIPALFILYLLSLLFVFVINFINTSMINNLFLKVFFIPLLIYILLSIFFGILDSIKNRDFKSLLILPFIYPLIHISFGYGMIIGYLRKIFK